jgi:hypothetical protein
MVEKLRRIVLLFCRDCLSRVAFGCSRVAFGWVALPTEFLIISVPWKGVDGLNRAATGK